MPVGNDEFDELTTILNSVIDDLANPLLAGRVADVLWFGHGQKRGDLVSRPSIGTLSSRSTTFARSAGVGIVNRASFM